MNEKEYQYVKDETVRPYPKKGRMLKRIIALMVVFCILLGGFFTINFVSSAFLPYDKNDDTEIIIDVPENSSASAIGTLLEEKGVIKSSLVFKVYTRLFGGAENIQAGRHTLTKQMTMSDILLNLGQGARAVGDNISTITFPEGQTLEEMANVFDQATKYSAKDFLDKVNEKAFILEMEKKYPTLLAGISEKPNLRYALEGYLYPATYDFDENSTVISLLDAMLAKRDEEMKKYSADLASSGRSVHEILTMASLVEREGLNQEDRNNIASTFYNRIKADMPLQTDISVLYAIKQHKEVVSLSDLEYDSLYNLYKYKGLGPGPFNSPSDSAIKASVYPSNTDYLYFFADIGTGKVYFTNDFNKHLEWQEEYKQNGRIKG